MTFFEPKMLVNFKAVSERNIYGVCVLILQYFFHKAFPGGAELKG